METGKPGQGDSNRQDPVGNGLHIFIRKHYGPFRRWLYPRVLRLPPVAD